MIMTNNDSDNTTLTLANLQNTIPNPPHSNTPYAAVVLSLYIAPQCVGTLIGRGGKTIHSIMRDAGKISLNPSVWVKILENSSTSPNTGTGTGTNLNSQVHPVEQAMDDEVIVVWKSNPVDSWKRNSDVSKTSAGWRRHSCAVRSARRAQLHRQGTEQPTRAPLAR